MHSQMVKRKQYTQEDLQKALRDIKLHRLTKRKASNVYKIPERTLSYKLKCTPKGFPVRCLSEEQETQLVSYIKYCAERAFPMSRKIIKVFFFQLDH